jgi:hypothetical protein
VTPNKGTQGTSFSVTVTGTNFQSGATVSFGSGAAAGAVAVVSATQLTATVTVQLTATVGVRTVTVTNPDGQSNGLAGAFEVVQSPAQPPPPGTQGPAVTSVTPAQGTQGSAVSVTISGADFQTGATVSFGAGVSVTAQTVVSATQLTVSVSIEAAATAGPRDVVVTNPDAAKGTLIAGFTVTLAALAHTFPAGLRLVAVPQDGLGAAPLLAGSGMLARWNPATASSPTYAKWEFSPVVAGAPGQFSGALQRGRGYFRTGASAAQVTFAAPDASAFEVAVSPGTGEYAGWNLLGNPHWSAVNISSLLARKQGQPASANQSLLEAAGANLVGDYAWGYPITEQGRFTLNGYQLYSASFPNALKSIPAGAGVWLFAIQEAILHWPGGVGLPPGPGGPPAPSTVRRSPAGWLVQLRARSSQCRDDYNYFGVGQLRSPLLNPPRVGGAPYVDLYLTSGTRSEGAPRLASSVLAAARSGGDSWSFAVESNQLGEALALSWPDLSCVPKNQRLTLADLTAGKTIPLRTVSAYTYVNRSAAPRAFEIRAEASSSSALLVTGFTARPTRGGSLALVYTLSQPAAVSLRVLSGAGRTVAGTANSTVSRAGPNQVAWAPAAEGASLSRGLYLVELTAHTDAGVAVKAVTAVRLR